MRAYILSARVWGCANPVASSNCQLVPKCQLAALPRHAADFEGVLGGRDRRFVTENLFKTLIKGSRQPGNASLLRAASVVG